MAERSSSTRGLGRHVGLAGGAGQRERDAGEILDDAVVEIGRDAPPFEIRRVERLPQQRLAFALALAQPAGQRPRERDLHELEHDERAERDGSEAPPDARAGRRDRAVAEVGLEQEPLAARRPDRQVHLEQLLLRRARSGSRAPTRSLTSASIWPLSIAAISSAPSGNRWPSSRGSSE